MYDYIIVGAGTAGSILASRLTESSKNSVLLLDSGKLDVGRWGKPADWYADVEQFWDKAEEAAGTLPQMALNGRKLKTVSAKGVGGASQIGYGLWQPPSAVAFDQWGVLGWTGSDMAPLIEKAEAMLPLYKSPLSEIGRKFSGALIQNRFQVNPAALMVSNSGRSAIVTNWFEQTRYRSNLTVRHDSHVLNLLFKNDQVVGIRTYRSDAEEVQEIVANKEVILCAGALHSPQILLLSGIGTVADLNRMGIFPRVNLPGVGDHFVDPPAIDLDFSIAEPARTHTTSFFNRKPDLTHLPEAVAVDDGGLMVKFWPENFENREKTGYRIRLTLTNPASSGRVSLRSTDALHMPRVNPNLLDQSSDIERLANGVAVVRKVFDELEIPGLEWPTGPRTNSFVVRAVQSSWGYQGTCRMGGSETSDAVVDADCKVIGIDGVRVVDASIIPRPMAAGTLATTVLIAERAAEKILAGSKERA